MVGGMRNLIIPAFIATMAGIGLDMNVNMLTAWWPNAPYAVLALLFWLGVLLWAVPFPTWAILTFLIPKLNPQWKVYKFLLTAVPLLFVFFVMAIVEIKSTHRVGDTQKQERYARSWIKLSNDISAEIALQMSLYIPPVPFQGQTPEEKRREREEWLRRSMQDNARLNSMFGAKVYESLRQMEEVGYDINNPTYRISPIMIPIEMQNFANAIGASGHELLMKLGKE
jgi:hypothetical protein